MATPLAALLPAPRQQFLDPNGKPLASGTVTTYVPNTQTLAPTWADPFEQSANANPQQLDGAGSWTFYGATQVQMVVKDSNGNIVWSGLTQDALSLATQAATSVVDAALAAFTLGTIAELNIEGDPSISIVPIAQGGGYTTLSTLSVSGTTNSPGEREFLVAINFTSNIGPGQTLADDKVALYVAAQGSGQTADLWALNPLLYMDSTSNATYNAQAVEVDLVNFQGDRASFSSIAAGIQVAGSNSSTSIRSTAAYVITGGGSPVFYYGFVAANDSVYTADLWTQTTATYFAVDNGTHASGIDLANATYSSNVGLLLGNAQNVASNNAAKSAEYPVLGVSSTNHVVLSNAAWGATYSANEFDPSADNTFQLGNGSFRWASVWAVNGTIQTSDATLKTDLRDLDPEHAIAIVRGLAPKAFRWIEGGQELVPTEVEVEGVLTETRVHKRDKVEVIDGVAHLTEEEFLEEVPQVDRVPLLGADGAPVVRKQRVPTGELDEKGAPVFETRLVPQFHSVPRRGTLKRTELRPRSVPGKRTHFGFVAQDLKAQIDAHGVDWGAYVADPAGPLGIRHDELLPVLWASTRAMLERLEALEAHVGAPPA